MAAPLNPDKVTLYTAGPNATPLNPDGTSGLPITGAGLGYTPSLTITRPADTDPYTAGDVIAASSSAGVAVELTNAGPSGGTVLITKALLQVPLAAIPSGMANFRAHFYNANPTGINDNAAYNLPSGDRAKHLGYVEFTTPEDLGDTLKSQNDLASQFKLATGATSFWIILETRGAYTPASGTVYTLSFSAIAA